MAIIQFQVIYPLIGASGNFLENYKLMQSYKLHIVSEHLRHRHPYLEPDFPSRYNQTEVYMPVFDRTIPKLIETLLMQNIESFKYRDALITLNELSSNDHEKDSMISQGLIGIASAYLHCKVVDIRREATLLLGSLLTATRGLKFIQNLTLEGIKQILFDQELRVRQSMGWCICRITLSREGVAILCKENIVKSIIQSFLKYSQGFKVIEKNYIIYLLQAFTSILAYDNGIEFALGTGLTKRLNDLCNQTVIQEKSVLYLGLYNLSKIVSNPRGKLQGIDQKIIRTSSNFLFSEDMQQVKFAIVVIMLTAIHLDGKKQCVYNEKGELDTDIVVKLIKLIRSTEGNTRSDVIETLKIISQLPDGFMAITNYMALQNHISNLEEIFEYHVVVPLAKLLPNPATIENPPVLPSAYIDQYKKYANCINFFLNKYDKAVETGLEETVDLIIKLVPFVCFRGDKELQQETTKSLVLLATKDQVAKERLYTYLRKYGKVIHRITQTCLEQQIGKYPQLAGLLAKQ